MKILDNDIFFAQVEEMIADGQNVVMRVKGHSMRPFIRDGRTRVQLSPCDADSVRKGDIVLFRYRGHHVMHRIIARSGDRLTLAGDGNYRKFEHCDIRDVVAIVNGIIRPDGNVIRCTSSRWRTASAIWVAMPQFIRRCILGILWRSGIR
ncbi:MAG: S24/S26 family peptidase [Alistipes sp.]|nr:S24/S26 family peptidase [Alistipes sp.]